MIHPLRKVWKQFRVWKRICSNTSSSLRRAQVLIQLKGGLEDFLRFLQLVLPQHTNLQAVENHQIIIQIIWNNNTLNDPVSIDNPYMVHKDGLKSVYPKDADEREHRWSLNNLFLQRCSACEWWGRLPFILKLSGPQSFQWRQLKLNKSAKTGSGSHPPPENG